jgi:hypothetical protein
MAQKGTLIPMPMYPPPLSRNLTLELSTNLHARHSRDRCPDARMTIRCDDDIQDLGTLRVDVEKPRLDLADASVGSIDTGDVIANTIDEAAWLAELARILAPGGTLHLMVPANGPLAWLDARNIYRYAGDILGRGDNPDSTLPTGWQRHYTPGGIRVLLLDAGFRDIRIERVGLGLTEIPQLAGFTVGNFLLGKRDTELRMRPLRQEMERIEGRIPAPFFGTMLSVSARRAPTEPDDPADDTAADNRSAPEIDSE